MTWYALAVFIDEGSFVVDEQANSLISNLSITRRQEQINAPPLAEMGHRPRRKTGGRLKKKYKNKGLRVLTL